VVRQFLNAQRQGPIGMAEEKDAAELEAEGDAELPPLPPIPPQIEPSNGESRKSQRPAGQWLKENNVEPPPNSFTGEGSYANSAAVSSAPPATTENAEQREGGSVRVLEREDDEDTGDAKPTQRLRRPGAKKTTAKRAAAHKKSDE
jgi:hypothetical protein